MKKIKQLVILLFLSSSALNSQVPIKGSVFGQNAWFILNTSTTPSTSIPWTDVAASGVQYVRIGGISANFTPLYTFDPVTFAITNADPLIDMINAVRNHSMQPIVQVGYDPITSPPTPSPQCSTALSPMTNLSYTDQATIAANLVAFINNPANGVLQPVTYWIISNEPDGDANCGPTPPIWGFAYNGQPPAMSSNNYLTHANNIATYIKAFSGAMKTKYPTIQIIGPELATFGNDKGNDGTVYYNPVNLLMNELISDPATNANSVMGLIGGIGPAATKYYVDIISFHYYSAATSRAAVIADPTAAADGFKTDLIAGSGKRGIIDMINALPTTAGRNISNLKVACTEFNLANAETSYDESVPADYTSIRAGYGNRSFLGGQWMAEVFAHAMNTSTVNPVTMKNESWTEFMNFWSIKENGSVGSPPDPCKDGKGYISNCTGSSNIYRSTYHHYKMLANNFSGTFYMGTCTTGVNNFKAFLSTSCKGIFIMVLNQNTTTTINTVRINLNGTMPACSSSEAGFQFGTPTSQVASKTNITQSIGPEETLLIKCDPCGRPLGYYVFNKSSTGGAVYHSYPGFLKSCFCINPRNNGNTNYARCTNPDTSGITNPVQIISGAVEISDSMWYPNTVRVPNGATLTIKNSEVIFSAGGKIYTEPPSASGPGGRVVIVNSYLHGCNGQAWEGITITNHNDSGHVPLVIDESIIEDAITAVTGDSINDLSISNSSFSNGSTAIQLNHCKNFTISGSGFGNYTDAIKTNNTMTGNSLISNNYFGDVVNGINMLNDNHSRLDINCNTFYHYANYAVKSVNCTLKNQGTATNGAGNTFTSVSALLNNKFSHTGNAVNYYTDPSAPFTLVTGIGMNATAITALSNGCSSSSARLAVNEQAANDKQTIDEGKAGIISCVPNPAKEQATIYFNLGRENTTGEILVTNIYGQMIERYKVNDAAAKIDIDCVNLANGIYFISLQVPGKIMDTKKLMIVK